MKYNSGGSLAGLGSVVVGKANATDGNLDGYMGFVVRSASALSEKVRIDKDGNVGIGTTGPSTKLHVYGGELKVEEGAATVEKNYAGETYFTIRNTQAASGGSGSVVLDFDSADTNNSRISQSNNLMDIAFADHFQIRKRLAVTPNIYIDNGGSGGSVGIGTTSPAEKLEVNGGIKVGNSTGTNAGTIRWNSGTSKLQVYDGSSWVNLH